MSVSNTDHRSRRECRSFNMHYFTTTVDQQQTAILRWLQTWTLGTDFIHARLRTIVTGTMEIMQTSHSYGAIMEMHIAVIPWGFSYIWQLHSCGHPTCQWNDSRSTVSHHIILRILSMIRYGCCHQFKSHLISTVSVYTVSVSTWWADKHQTQNIVFNTRAKCQSAAVTGATNAVFWVGGDGMLNACGCTHFCLLDGNGDAKLRLWMSQLRVVKA